MREENENKRGCLDDVGTFNAMSAVHKRPTSHGTKFTQKGSFTQHLETVHSSDGPRYAYEVCGKKFAQDYLGIHL